MKHKQDIERDMTRRRPAMGRGLRELLMHGELGAAAERARHLRRPAPDPIPAGIPPFARDWAAKVWRKSGKPL